MQGLKPLPALQEGSLLLHHQGSTDTGIHGPNAMRQ